MMTGDQQRISCVSAVVLHTRPFRNSSLIVELFTRDFGRVAAVAKSARGPRSRYRGRLMPFSPLIVSWTGRHELKTLGVVESIVCGAGLGGDALLCGFYLNELLMRLLGKEDPYPDLFDRYLSLLHTLDTSHAEVGLRYFECHLLNALGYGLSLTQDYVSGRSIDSHLTYRYVPAQGFLQTENVHDINAFSGHVLLALSQQQLSTKDDVKAAKRLMRLVLSRHLGEKPIYSRDLF